MLNQLERSATDLVARLAPWLAPIPTAYLVGRATVLHLHWPDAVGVVAAVIVESLGLATTVTALELREYNASKRKSDPAAPFTLAAGLVALYLAVAVALTVVLDTVPALALYAPAVFPGLSLAGMVVLALRYDHGRRLTDIAADKAERTRQRAAKRPAIKRQAEPAPATAPAMPDNDNGDGRQPLTYAAFCREYPEVIAAETATGRQVAALAGVSDRTGRHWLARRKEASV